MSAAPELAGYPFAPQRVEVGGHTMSYVDARPEGGERAAPVLLVHGNPTWSFYWRRLLTALPAAGRRAVAPDHVGMGLSDKPAATEYPHTLARRVADLDEFVDAVLGDGPLSLVVHDWGGPIGLAWAVEHAERIERLVVLNSAAFPLPADHALPWTLRAARLPWLGETLVTRFNAFALGALVLGSGRPLLDRPWLDATARRGLLAPYDSPAHRVAVHAFVRDIPVGPQDPAHPVLVRLAERLGFLADVPTTVCWGMKDPVFDADILGHLLAALPHADVHRFPDAGHYVLEDAAEQIVPIVVDALSP